MWTPGSNWGRTGIDTLILMETVIHQACRRYINGDGVRQRALPHNVSGTLHGWNSITGKSGLSPGPLLYCVTPNQSTTPVEHHALTRYARYPPEFQFQFYIPIHLVSKSHPSLHASTHSKVSVTIVHPAHLHTCTPAHRHEQLRQLRPE